MDLDGLAAVLRAGTNTRSKQVTDPVSGTVTQITTLYNLPKPNSLLSSAQAVLFALQARRDVLDRLVVDTQLPVCRYAIRYDDAILALLPHLSLHKTMAQLLRIRAIARINAGNPMEPMRMSWLSFDSQISPVPSRLLLVTSFLWLFTQSA